MSSVFAMFHVEQDLSPAPRTGSAGPQEDWLTWAERELRNLGVFHVEHPGPSEEASVSRSGLHRALPRRSRGVSPTASAR